MIRKNISYMSSSVRNGHFMGMDTHFIVKFRKRINVSNGSITQFLSVWHITSYNIHKFSIISNDHLLNLLLV